MLFLSLECLYSKTDSLIILFLKHDFKTEHQENNSVMKG